MNPVVIWVTSHLFSKVALNYTVNGHKTVVSNREKDIFSKLSRASSRIRLLNRKYTNVSRNVSVPVFREIITRKWLPFASRSVTYRVIVAPDHTHWYKHTR